MIAEKFPQWLIAVAIALSAVCAKADPYYANGKGDEIWDKVTGLVWARCSVGQNWTGRDCEGEAKSFTFQEAQKLTGEVWALPTIRQLASLISCANGDLTASVDVADGKPAIASGCPNGHPNISTINPISFPSQIWENRYWSSSIDSRYDRVWLADFFSGNVSSYYGERDRESGVRLVRAMLPTAKEAFTAFPTEITAPTSEIWSAAVASADPTARAHARARDSNVPISASGRPAGLSDKAGEIHYLVYALAGTLILILGIPWTMASDNLLVSRVIRHQGPGRWIQAITLVVLSAFIVGYPWRALLEMVIFIPVLVILTAMVIALITWCVLRLKSARKN